MFKYQNSIHRGVRATGLAIMLLLAIVTPWVQAAAPTTVTSVVTNVAPVTIRGSWSFTDSADVNSLPGMYLAGVTSDGKHAIALAWVPEASGWWPTWRLVLASESGLLPENTPQTYTVPGWENSKGIDLGTHSPISGHKYEPLLSYDPQNGALSVSLTDLTTGEQVRANGFQLPKAAASFTVAGGQLNTTATSGNQVSISDLRTAAEYVPAGTKWQVGVHEEALFIPNSIINLKEKYYLRLDVAGPAPKGQYRVFLSHDGTRSQLDIQPKLNGEVLFPATQLPLGKSQVTLEYSEQGRVILSQSSNITLGQVNVAVSNTTVDRKDLSANSVLRLTSDGPLAGVDVSVKATVTELIWDKDAHKYHEEVAKNEVFNLAHDLSVTDGKDVQLPIKVSLPNRPSLWKVDLQPVISPDISVIASAKSVTVNTYAAPVIEPDQPFTIAVFPDTQYYSGYAPVILDRMTQWVLEEADKQNIALALGVGDITDRNTNDQWENAQRSYSQFNGLIPYALALGNHDMAPIGHVGSVAHRGESQFMNYFSRDYFTGLQGNYPEGHLDNTYHTFRINGVDYLVVALEFCPPNEVLDWANKIVDSFPNHKTIIITHAYTSSSGLRVASGASLSYPMGQDKTTTMNDGADIWTKFVRNHKNIFLVFSGHINGTAIPYHIDRGINGNTVYEFLVDYQDHDNGWLVTFQFTLDNKININSYSPYLDKNNPNVSKYGYTNRYQIDMNTGRINYKF